MNLIDHLPAASHFAEAQAEDEELARALLNRPLPAHRPRISEWSPVVAELNNIADRLGEVAAILIAVNGGKPRPVRPRPRPQTAMDRIREQDRAEKHDGLVARLLHANDDGREASHGV